MFYSILYHNHLLTSLQNFTEIFKGKPLRRAGRGLIARWVAICSDVGPVEGYISETVQDAAMSTINDYPVIGNHTRKIQWYHFRPSRVTPSKCYRIPILGKPFVFLKFGVRTVKSDAQIYLCFSFALFRSLTRPYI